MEDPENSVVGDISDVLHKLLKHLQYERDRLVSKAQRLTENGAAVKFVRNEQFDIILENLTKTHIGNVEQTSVRRSRETTSLRPSTSLSSAEVIIDGDRSASALPGTWLPHPVALKDVPVDPRLSRRRKLPRIPYENYEVIALVAGKDMLGKTISRPSSVVALPDLKVFAVLHNNDRISLISPEGDIRATFTFEKLYKPVPNASPTVLARHPFLPNELVCIHGNQLKTIGPIDCALNEPDPVNHIEAEKRVVDFKGPPFGLAVNAAARVVYTALGGGIAAYRLDDWSYLAQWQFRYDEGDKSLVLDVLGDKVLYRGAGARKMFAAPIVGDGSLDLREAKCIGKFDSLYSIHVDEEMNVLVIDKTRRSIEVMAANTNEKITAFAPSSKYGSFTPADVAVFSQPSKTRSDRKVVAVADFFEDRVLLFSINDHDS